MDRSRHRLARMQVMLEDNRLLPNLLGECDQHLALLEDHLDVTATAHGNIITLSGDADDCRLARSILEELYQRASKRQDVCAGDFEGLIRHRGQFEDVLQSKGEHVGQEKIVTRRRQITARTPAQSDYIRALKGPDLVFGIGPSGTGKTYLAVAFAAQSLECGLVERIILSRPAVEAGERLGFLPGDMKDKVDPYLRPLYDAMYDVLPFGRVAKDIENGIIEIAPLAFMRGRTLANAFIILDEAQNTTIIQMKMFLTRLGSQSKMVVTGDPGQIDLPDGLSSGLEHAAELLGGVEGISAIEFSPEDVVRRTLVARIIEAYDGAS